MNTLLALAYLLAAVLFILGLKQLSSPKGARNGNFTAAAGMVIALGATIPLLHFTSAGIVIIAIGLVIGTVVGTVGARLVHMTAIPQMVALFNGVGGGAAALVAVAELLKLGVHPPFSEVLPSVFSIVIGSVSFAGSLVAFSKLQELMTGTPITYPGQQVVNAVLAYSQRVIIVPGYGLAVAQAQHAARELADALEKRGVDVEYAIHPVAGRMPGHMNVLLAEANVPYEQLKEMDQVNDDFKNADVALIVGANDVVNPAARTTPGSPIYGMPILNADQAKNVIFMKRSMRPGFAGIENELMYGPNTVMFFGDAKDSLTKLVSAVKAA